MPLILGGDVAYSCLAMRVSDPCLRFRFVGEKVRRRIPRLRSLGGMGGVSRGSRLIRRGIRLVRRVAFGMAVQLADMMTLAREEEYQGAGCNHEPGFAKKRSHKVRHTKRRVFACAREKAFPSNRARAPARDPSAGAKQADERDY